MDRKKELKQMYRLMKPEMGILQLKNKVTGSIYLAGVKDTKAAKNSNDFTLKAGGHTNKELQDEWNRYGDESFEFSVIDTLEYSKDESKTDYNDDLKVLRSEWLEKLKGAKRLK